MKLDLNANWACFNNLKTRLAACRSEEHWYYFMSSPKAVIKNLVLEASKREMQLVGLLSALSEELAVQLAEALERDRLAGGSGLPFEAIMTGLRPKLRQRDRIERKRTPTPQRVFFEIADGMITDTPTGTKQTGRIARASLAPIWKWLLVQQESELSPMADELKPYLLTNNRAKCLELLAAFDAAAGLIIRQAVKAFEDGEKSAKGLIAALGSQRIYEDMREFGRMLQIAPEIRSLRNQLPTVIAFDNEEHFSIILATYDGAIERAPNAVSYLVLSLLPIVAHPWDLFGIAGRLVEAEDDQDLKDSELEMVGEWLVKDLEAEADRFKDLNRPGFDPNVADDGLRRFAVLQAGMTRKIGMRKDGQWGKRLMKARGSISNGLEGLFHNAFLELKSSLPMEKAKSGPRKGSFVPKMDGVPKSSLIERLEAIMQLLATAGLFATQLGYKVSFEKTRNEVIPFMESYANAVVDILRDARRKERETCLAWAEACVVIMTPFCGEDSVKIICRRISAASPDAGADI